jgi:RNase H-fold protein (predicted Holliday junction resolvase)
MTILGISIGTTSTAVAILRNGKLLDRELHTYHEVWSDMKLRQIINRYKRYVKKRNVQAIIVKIPPPRKHTKAMKLILKRVEALAKDHHCHFDLITKSEMRHELHLHVHSTNMLIECARVLYPDLGALYQKSIMNDHRYYRKLFEAVLAAHIYQEREGIK